MNAFSLFDEQETRGGGHTEAYERLTQKQKATIRMLQAVLQGIVDIWNGEGKFIPTSGWRSSGVNVAVGGSAASRHLWGLARDFIPANGDLADPPIVPKGFRVIKSKNCWHVEFRVSCQ